MIERIICALIGAAVIYPFARAAGWRQATALALDSWNQHFEEEHGAIPDDWEEPEDD